MPEIFAASPGPLILPPAFSKVSLIGRAFISSSERKGRVPFFPRTPTCFPGGTGDRKVSKEGRSRGVGLDSGLSRLRFRVPALHSTQGGLAEKGHFTDIFA
jgi:hypothetical protein